MEVVKSITFLGKELIRVERNRAGEFFYSFLDGSNNFAHSSNYLKLSLENFVFMTIVSLRSQLYSQMRITHLDSSGKEIKNSPVLKLLKNPNYFQSQQDFLYQGMWFRSVAGTNLTHQIKAFSNDLPKSLYNLVPSQIDLNNANKLNTFITTKQQEKAFGQRTIKYTLDDKQYNIPLSELIPFYDLANGITENSFFQSPSRVKGIIKVLSNIDEAVKSKNINLQFSQKYLSKNQSTGNEAQILEPDRKDIESKIDRKNLIISNAAIQVQHLVSDMKKLYLDEQLADDANKCLLAFDMNKDVLNYFAKDSTFENQKQGLISYIQNGLQPIADSDMDSFAQSWGLFDKGERLVASYDHLPVMQSVMNDKIASFKSMQEAIKLGKENGTVTDAEAVQMSKEFKLKLGL